MAKKIPARVFPQPNIGNISMFCGPFMFAKTLNVSKSSGVHIGYGYGKHTLMTKVSIISS